MPRLPAALSALLLAGCGAAGPVAIDIVEAGPARSGSSAGPESVLLDVEVRAGPLRGAVDAGGRFDLRLFDCATPGRPGETVPLTFGGETLGSVSSSQISDNPEMLVQLSATAPRSAVEGAGKCARLVKAEGGPEIVSKAVELRAN